MPTLAEDVISPPAPQQSLLDQAKQIFPILQHYDIGFKNNIGAGSGFMESFPPGETGTPAAPRPAEFPLDKFGVENYKQESTPDDLMADITSHHLINVDPVVRQTYLDFASSLNQHQKDILKDQFSYAQKNEGEKRSYEEWEQRSGLPGFFRGYTFKQWPQEFNQKAYTPEQMKKLDGLLKYLKGNDASTHKGVN